MTWHWEQYYGGSEGWGLFYKDGRYDDEFASISKNGKVYVTHISNMQDRAFDTLTDAKRFVERDIIGNYLTKKRKTTAHPFGL